MLFWLIHPAASHYQRSIKPHSILVVSPSNLHDEQSAKEFISNKKIVISRLLKSSFPLLSSSISRYKKLPVKLARSDTAFDRRLVLVRCIGLHNYLPVPFVWDYLTDICCNHGSFDFGRLVLSLSTFISWHTLSDCRRSVRLQTSAVVPDEACRNCCM